jgi:hypothetical protein
MDDVDRNNLVVLTVFAGCLVAVIIGYLLAWRANGTGYRKAGSIMTAVVAGFGGFGHARMVDGYHPALSTSRWKPHWQPLVFFLAFSPLPFGAFYFCAKFIRQALRDDQK